MPHEQSPQPNLAEVYDQNHAEILDYMGWLQSAISSNYRNERPRTAEHIGKQEELKAMIIDALDIARSQAGRLATDATTNERGHDE